MYPARRPIGITLRYKDGKSHVSVISIISTETLKFEHKLSIFRVTGAVRRYYIIIGREHQVITSGLPIDRNTEMRVLVLNVTKKINSVKEGRYNFGWIQCIFEWEGYSGYCSISKVILALHNNKWCKSTGSRPASKGHDQWCRFSQLYEKICSLFKKLTKWPYGSIRPHYSQHDSPLHQQYCMNLWLWTRLGTITKKFTWPP